MAPAYLLDAAGLAREKPPLVMDLGQLQLPNSKSASAKNSKGKSIISVQSPIGFAPTDCTLLDESPSEISNPLPKTDFPAMDTTVLGVRPETVDPNSKFQSTGPSNAPSSSWSKVVSTPSVSSPQLNFMKPIFTGDSNLLSIPLEMIEIGRKKYSCCLIGQFVGTTPNLGLIHAMANRLWGRDGPISVSRYKEELFLFQFPDDAAYSRAFTRGPWHIGGVPLIFRPWTSSSKKLDFSNATFPVWIKLKNVPMELLTKEGLSYLSSVLGTPLHTDQDCSKIFKSDCVNVCVQVDFSKPLLNELKLDLHGKTVIIEVIYSWKLPHCDFCHGWGHHEIACSEKKVTKIWVPKQTAAPPKPTPSPPHVEESIPPSSTTSLPVSPAVKSIPVLQAQPADHTPAALPSHPVIPDNKQNSLFETLPVSIPPIFAYCFLFLSSDSKS
ncbi:hypothetical protein Tsubulata_022001 [Turnera subulata]|uniref:DUF4283 domain-containing protein n=1 Tax=Turnera subulata TaxID=218843 RepID=A0A9Q0IYQ3_9ROSI|nr:hypothetical protein Tsubulata_022001 [Turnera subulata]